MAWPKTKAGNLARKRNFHKFQIKGTVALLTNQLNNKEVPPCELERILLATAVNALEDALVNWETSTNLIKS